MYKFSYKHMFWFIFWKNIQELYFCGNGNWIFKHVRKYQIVAKWLHHFIFLLAMSESSSCSMPLLALDIISLFTFNHLRCISIANCAFNLGFSYGKQLYYFSHFLCITGLLKTDFSVPSTSSQLQKEWDNGTSLSKDQRLALSLCDSEQLIIPLLMAMALGCLSRGSDFFELPARVTLLSWTQRFSFVHLINGHCALLMYQSRLWVPGMWQWIDKVLALMAPGWC